MASSENNIYEGTEQGLSLYHDGTWTRLFPRGWATLPGQRHRPTEDEVWVGTYWGLLVLDDSGPVLHTTAGKGDGGPSHEGPVVPDTITTAGTTAVTSDLGVAFIANR